MATGARLYAKIRNDVESIAREEVARGGTWESGFGRAEVEYGFEDLPNDSVTPLPVKMVVALAVCDLKRLHSVVDLGPEQEAIAELLSLVHPSDLAASFTSAELQAMAAVARTQAT